MRQNNSQKGIIWSSSQPLCPGYPSPTSVPLDEAKWDQLLSEGPHQIAGFHPPTTLIWGSSLTLPLSNTDFHRRSHPHSFFFFFTVLKHCHVTDPQKSPSGAFWWDLALGNVPLQLMLVCYCRTTWADESDFKLISITGLSWISVVSMHDTTCKTLRRCSPFTAPSGHSQSKINWSKVNMSLLWFLYLFGLSLTFCKVKG